MTINDNKNIDIGIQKNPRLIPSGTSPTQRGVSHVLQGGWSLVDVSYRRNNVAKKKVAEVWKKGDKQLISFAGHDDTVVIITTSSNVKLSKKAWKIYEFLRQKVNERCSLKTIDGTDILENPSFKFSLSEMVSAGMYKTEHIANDAFHDVFQVLRDELYIDARAKIGGRMVSVAGGLFDSFEQENSIITVDVNRHLSFWKVYNQFITYLPGWYFQTKPKTQILTSLIADEARLMDKQRKLKDCGSFTISAKSVWEAMNLPYTKGSAPKGPDGKPIAKETTQGKRDIVAPIENAIDEITDLEKDPESATGLRVTLGTKSGKCYLNERASEFLEDGVLTVELSGSYLEEMISHSQEIDAERNKAEKRHEKAQIAAEAALLKKKLE